MERPAAQNFERVRLAVVGAPLGLIRAVKPPGFTVDRFDNVARAQTGDVGGAAGANVGSQIAVGSCGRARKNRLVVCRAARRRRWQRGSRCEPARRVAQARSRSTPCRARARACARRRRGRDDLMVVPFVDDPAAAILQAQTDVEIVAFDQREARSRDVHVRGVRLSRAIGCVGIIVEANRLPSAARQRRSDRIGGRSAQAASRRRRPRCDCVTDAGA